MGIYGFLGAAGAFPMDGPHADPVPNTTGLPGIAAANNIVGALLTFGIIAAIAGIVVSAIVWAIGGNSSNPQLAHRGKSGVLIALVAALVIGGSKVLVNFMSDAGAAIS